MCYVLLPRFYSLHAQVGCVMSDFPLFVPCTHRVDVCCLNSQCSSPILTGQTHNILLPCFHSLHTQVGCVMSYFPLFVPCTHRVVVCCLTYQCSSPILTGQTHNILLPSVHSLHTQGGCVMSDFPVQHTSQHSFSKHIELPKFDVHFLCTTQKVYRWVLEIFHVGLQKLKIRSTVYYFMTK